MPATYSPHTGQSDATGFKDHAHSDAVLPSSPEEEQLTPIPTTRGTPNSIVDSQAGNFAPFNSAASPYSTGDARFKEEEHNDLQFMGMNEFDAPDFSNNYLIEAKFGDFPSAAAGDPAYHRDQVSAQQEEPMSATSTTSRSANTFSRKSTGLATMSSSQLMSPQLTDAASPPSGFDGGNSPTMQHRLLGGGNMTQPSSAGTPVDSSNPTFIQTPAATGSSVDASPNMDHSHGRFPAPRVQVEKYSRGDSPARVENLPRQSDSKKRRGSRSSLHLAAPAPDSSEDGEYEESYEETTGPHRQYSGVPESNVSRRGLTPSQRDQLRDQTVKSLSEQGAAASLQARNAEVSHWLSTSEASAFTNTVPPPSASRSGRGHAGSRLRAKSTGNRLELQADAFGLSRGRRVAQDAAIPGPGILLDEESGDDDEEAEDEDSALYAEEAPASIGGRYGEHELPESFPPLPENPPRAQDAYPWIDPIYFPSHPGAVGQPGTSNEAMMRFAKRAQDVETASRAATWGTNPRRLSDGDLQRVFGSGGLLSRLSVSRHGDRDPEREKDWRQLKESVETRVLNLLPKRSGSTTKRKQSEPTHVSSKETPATDSARKDSTHKRKESLQSLHERKESLSATFKRLPSVKRPKSPNVNTSGTVTASFNVNAHGTGSTSPTENQSPTHKHSVLRQAREMLSRHSSRDASEPNLTALWTQSGGPPLPNFSSTSINKDDTTGTADEMPQDAEGDSEETTDDKGVKMELNPKKDTIIPTFDGFKINVLDVNPRLPTYLVERLGHEQLRRYKKLVEFKVKHAQAIQLDKCESGAHCIEKGGLPTYFPAKPVSREPALSQTGFGAAENGAAEEDEDDVPDGLVTEAQFPPGVPMPPVKRLPAKFECPLCFSVKKFTKPSDWSKHVHEDLQPFTCTFVNCADPKSFKRKADWVRHENERHRQLEWWQCTEDGCAHQCYRRDNFVQHLVREHKMPEPKAKTVKPDNKPAVRGPAKTKGRGAKDFAPEDRVLMMVEQCRRETTKNPMDEPCKFCGNVCNTFKKLTVHLARHMEQISMPVLDLVKLKDVTPDTIISPIEAKLAQTSISSTGNGSYRGSVSVSPFDQPLEPPSTMPDLPGAFRPLTGPNFQHPHFNNVMAWNNSAGVDVPLPQNAAPFDTSLTNTWMQGDTHYPNSHGQGYRTMEMAPGTYTEQPGVSSTNAFPRIQGAVPHGLSIPYQGQRDYTGGMVQSPHFHIPQNVNGGGGGGGGGGAGGVGGAEAAHHDAQMQYEVNEPGAYVGGGLNGQGLYAGQQPIHHGAQQQQQFYTSY